MESSKLVEELQRRAIQNFMDVFILVETKKHSLSGYDVISLMHKRFGILISSGTVYSLLYSLERDGWLKGVWKQRKRVYELTEKGKQNIEIITRANGELQNFVRNISVLNTNSHTKLTPT